MNKKGILLIAILVVGLGCMYFIADTSHSVGSAIVDVNNSVVTLPPGFSIKETNASTAVIKDWDTKEEITIADLGKQNSAQKEFDDRYNSLSKEDHVKDIDKKTKDIGDAKVYSIDYEKDNTKHPKHVSYVYKGDHTYKIKMTGYKDMGKVDKDLEYVVDSIQPDYKKSQD